MRANGIGGRVRDRAPCLRTFPASVSGQSLSRCVLRGAIRVSPRGRVRSVFPLSPREPRPGDTVSIGHRRQKSIEIVTTGNNNS